MSDRMRYTPPYFESYDDISFNMEIPGGSSRSRCTTPSRLDPRLTVSRPSRATSIQPDEFRPIRRSRQSTPEEEAYNHRKLHSTPKIPSYTEALVSSSRKHRARAMSPPILIDDPEPRVLIRHRGISVDRKPPLPKPSIIATDYYRKSMRTIFDRQPLFQDFLQDSPEDKSLGIYNLTDIYRMKSNFRGMLSDKYKRMTYNDPAVERDIGRKLLPWRDHLKREEPASKRIVQDHAHQRSRVSLSPVPRLTVYHRSTNPRSY
uniref:Uncharacterized protein n=1 Tax=Lepeophtheirus salmonis TaxID=72036 RepID=A0A0K2UPK1_LEPSM